MGVFWRNCLVITAAFSGYLIVYGVNHAFGVLRKPLLEILDVNMASVSLIGSVQSGVDSGVGVFACGLVERFGMMKVNLAGGILFVASTIACGFINNWFAMMLVLGVIGGIALGLINTTCVLAPTMYCSEHRGLACGITQVGASCAMAFPMLVDLTLSTVGTKYTFVILGLTGLIVCALAFGIQPSQESSNGQEDSGATLEANCQQDLKLENQDGSGMSVEDRRGSLLYPGDLELIGRRRSSTLSTIVIDEINAKDGWTEACKVLLTNTIFVLYLFAFFMYGIVTFLPIFFLFKIVEEQGIDPFHAKSLVPVMGIASGIARLVLGFVLDQPWMDSLVLQTCCFGFGMVSALCMIFCATYLQFLLASILMAVSLYSIYPTTSIVLVDVFGMDKLTKSFGLVSITYALGMLIGSPIAGHLYDVYQTFGPILFLITGPMMGGTVCLIIMRLIIIRKG